MAFTHRSSDKKYIVFIFLSHVEVLKIKKCPTLFHAGIAISVIPNRGPGCRNEVSGVLPNLEFPAFYQYFIATDCYFFLGRGFFDVL